MLLNVLALVVVAAVACMCAAQGVYRATQNLVALVLAGALAFGWFAPVTRALFSSADDPAGIWYYAGDALCLWAVLCVVFLGLRTAGERLLPNQPAFLPWADHAGGGAIGLVVGYVAVGVCLVLVQMLPVAPRFLGYEVFRYVEGAGESDPERIEPGDRLYLAPDRGVLTFFAYLSEGCPRPEPLYGQGTRTGVGGPLGSAGSDTPGLLNRYADVYPPPQMRGDGYAAVTDVDDILYYHWYRRWQYIHFRTGSRLGPIPEVPAGTAAEHALPLDRTRSTTLYGMSLRVSRAARSDSIEEFPDERPPQGEEFLAVTVRFKPVRRWPRTIDSAQFHLIDGRGVRVGGPSRIHGTAKRPAAGADAEPEVVGRSSCPASFPRALRFAFPEGGTKGRYLMDGARFHFVQKREYVSRILVFTVPSRMRTDQLRLFMDPKVPPLPLTDVRG